MSILGRLGLTGLSPRARGSLIEVAAVADREGSIPAGAGKPGRELGLPAMARVYPRGRGEALGPSRFHGFSKGLSPRARGSHVAALVNHHVTGSIPAGAGKPTSRNGTDVMCRVYPRGRGEAFTIINE